MPTPRYLSILALVMSLLFSPLLPAKNLPDISGESWLNSDPLQQKDLEGKVVLVEFWTYGCYNCKNVEPYIKQWHQRYADQGLIIIAVHTPESTHEQKLDNVQAYVGKNNIAYPVLLDNDFANWRRFSNRYWPTVYLADRKGELRYKKIGEGAYAKTEQWIQKLLAEPSR